MRVGIIGAGAVGSACALALVMRGAAREVVLVDRTRERARAVATDMRYGAPLSPLVDIRDGDFNDLAGAALVMVTAGVNEKAGGAIDRSDAAGRLKLLDINRGIYESLIPRLVEAASDAVILVVTDPPDPLADIARGLAHHDRVLSTGTYLDSCLFRFLSPSMQQLQQCALVDFELLQRLALDARHDTGNEPARLAHLDDGDQRAVRFEGIEGSAQVVQLLHGGAPSVQISVDGCNILAAVRPSAQHPSSAAGIRKPSQQRSWATLIRSPRRRAAEETKAHRGRAPSRS